MEAAGFEAKRCYFDEGKCRLDARPEPGQGALCAACRLEAIWLLLFKIIEHDSVQVKIVDRAF